MVSDFDWINLGFNKVLSFGQVLAIKKINHKLLFNIFSVLYKSCTSFGFDLNLLLLNRQLLIINNPIDLLLLNINILKNSTNQLKRIIFTLSLFIKSFLNLTKFILILNHLNNIEDRKVCPLIAFDQRFQQSNLLKKNVLCIIL